jgi:pimeloyl-ACP methyl ester carboxylesterase
MVDCAPAHDDGDEVLRLSDGRRMRVVGTGPADGLPVVYCHGAIGTPLAGSAAFEALTVELGIRHLAIDRPGVGGSDPAPGRRLVDFATDVGEVADRLGLGRFAVVGVSAGGPYALGLARELPDRVLRVALCSSISPLCELRRTPGLERHVRVALGLLDEFPGALSELGDLALPLVRRRPDLVAWVIAQLAGPASAASCWGAPSAARSPGASSWRRTAGWPAWSTTTSSTRGRGASRRRR